MTRTMTATEARIHFGEALRFVEEHGEPIYVYKDGKPKAVLVSIESYERRENGGMDAGPDWLRRARATREQMPRVLNGRPLGDVDERINGGRGDVD